MGGCGGTLPGGHYALGDHGRAPRRDRRTVPKGGRREAPGGRRQQPARTFDRALAEGRIPTEAEVLAEQRKLFRAKFGRDCGPDDPVFFDPDKDEPTPWAEGKVRAETLEAMRRA